MAQPLTKKKFSLQKCRKVVDGLEKDGSDYFKHCPRNEVELVSKLCTHPKTHDDKNLRRLAKPFRKYDRSLKGSNMGMKRNILSKPQVGNGVFTLLSTVLPAFISALTGKWLINLWFKMMYTYT